MKTSNKMKKLKIVYSVSICGSIQTFNKFKNAIAYSVKNNITIIVASYKNIEKGYKVEDFSTWKIKTEQTIQNDFYCEIL